MRVAKRFAPLAIGETRQVDELPAGRPLVKGRDRRKSGSFAPLAEPSPQGCPASAMPAIGNS